MDEEEKWRKEVSPLPCAIFAKQWSDSPEVTFKLLKEPWTLAAEELPAVVPPRGLSTEWQWYLYASIHQFCPHDDKDTVCPLPFVRNLAPAGMALQS